MSASNSIYKLIFQTAAFLTGCCLLMSCENSAGAIREWTTDSVLKEEARGVESYISQEGKVKARLQSPLMYRVNLTQNRDSMYVEFPTTLHVDFYNDSAAIDSRLDSRYGKYFENLDMVYLRDSVVVISAKGDTLKCQDLWWDQKRGLFYSDRYSRYIAKGADIQAGKGLEATQDMKTVTFKEPTGPVEVSSTGMAN